MDSNVIFPELPTYAGVPSWGGFLSLLVTVFLPVIAALFMRVTWSPLTRGLVLLGFAAVKAYVEAWLVAVDAHTAFDHAGAAYTVVVQFALAVISYFGLMRGTEVQKQALAGGVVKGVPRKRRVR